MGGVDQLDSAVTNYRIKIKNNIKILLTAAWKIWKEASPKEKDHSELVFEIRFFQIPEAAKR